MTINKELAGNLREALSRKEGISEWNMFGGLTFLMQGNMLCGTAEDRYMFRVGKQREAEARAMPGAEAVVFGGRRMGGMFWVDKQSCPRDLLNEWLRMAEDFVGPMPPKQPKR